jgi:hypothetical protein
MARMYQPKITWTPEMDAQLIEIVTKAPRIYDGFKQAADQIDKVRNVDQARSRWYSPQIKEKIGIPANQDQRKNPYKRQYKPKSRVTELVTHVMDTEPQKHDPLPYNNENTKEAKSAISDFKECLNLLTDAVTRLLNSNMELLKENERIKVEHNRLIKDHDELSESYTHMLKMINQARLLALKEEDEKANIVI